MINNFPFVSIIIPCCNEEKYIAKCLDSIISQDYPSEKLEIVVVDGMSSDKTREVLHKYIHNNSFIRMLNNPKKVTPVAMNVGIKAVHGDYVLIISSHSKIDQGFIKRNVESIIKYDVDCVGGVMKTLPANDSVLAQSIAFALSNPFGVGNAYFRIGSNKPKYVDTVPFGCYKRKVFQSVGLFDESLVRNQDIELNLRLKQSGGRILLIPDIISYYYARPTLKSLFQQNFWNGFWVIFSSRFAKLPFSLRHLIPFAFVLSVFGSLAACALSKYAFYTFILIVCSYGALNIFFTLKLSLEKTLKHFPTLLLSFVTLHFSYGLGSLWGAIKLVLPYKMTTNA